MVEITENTKKSEEQNQIEEMKGLVKKVFGFPFVINNLGMSFYIYPGFFNTKNKIRIEGDVLLHEFDYEIYINQEKYLDKSKELAELFESHYLGKKVCVIKELPFK